VSQLDRFAAGTHAIRADRPITADRPTVLSAITDVTVGAVAERWAPLRCLGPSWRERAVYATLLRLGGGLLAAVPLREVVLGLPGGTRGPRLVLGVSLRPANTSTHVAVELRLAGLGRPVTHGVATLLRPVGRPLLDAWLDAVAARAAQDAATPAARA
jgi:hypothetical protein